MHFKHRNPPLQKAFTLIELLVVISIIAILASLAIPAVMGALSSGKSAGCISNLRQIGLGINTYAMDGDFQFPTSDGNPNDPGWARKIADLIDVDLDAKKTIFVCPGCDLPVADGNVNDVAITYGMHAALANGLFTFTDVTSASSVILVADMPQDPGNKGWSANQIETPSVFGSGEGGRSGLDAEIPASSGGGLSDEGGNGPRYRHADKCNVVFVDGSASSFKTNTMTYENAVVVQD